MPGLTIKESKSSSLSSTVRFSTYLILLNIFDGNNDFHDDMDAGDEEDGTDNADEG